MVFKKPRCCTTWCSSSCLICTYEASASFQLCNVPEANCASIKNKASEIVCVQCLLSSFFSTLPIISRVSLSNPQESSISAGCQQILHRKMDEHVLINWVWRNLGSNHSDP